MIAVDQSAATRSIKHDREEIATGTTLQSATITVCVMLVLILRTFSLIEIGDETREHLFPSEDSHPGTSMLLQVAGMVAVLRVRYWSERERRSLDVRCHAFAILAGRRSVLELQDGRNKLRSKAPEQHNTKILCSDTSCVSHEQASAHEPGTA
jgi:hypothetical protein